MTEEWRVVPQTEGKYHASSLGRFKGPRGILKQHPHPTRRYLYVGLTINGKKSTYRAHRIVLLTFDRAPQPGEEARHLNGDRTDNRIDNLSWGTRADNDADKKSHGTARGAHPGEKHHNSKLRDIEREIVCFLYDNGVEQKYIAMMYGITQSNVCRVVQSGKKRNSQAANERVELRMTA